MNATLSIASLIMLALIAGASLNLNVQARSAEDARAHKFIAEHEARIRPLEKALNLAWWTANVSGKNEDYKAKEQAQNNLDQALADKERFAELKAVNETGERMLRNQLLIFSRWCQVMLRFEKELYANPNQDLNKLWWALVEKYQMMKRPEGRNAPDYASKIHIVAAPAYYHNYMMGQLFASQLHHAIARKVLKADPHTALYVGKADVGDFMKKYVFAPGKTMPWNALTEFATGKELNAKAFAADFQGK
jgi:oligoendopeptidase F